MAGSGLPGSRVPPERSEQGRVGGGAFVGRERELGELDLGLRSAVAGRGRLFLLSGEPGVGKSTLADVVSQRAAAHGCRSVWGRCWEAGGAPAYWPWLQAIRSYLREPDAGQTLDRL